MLFFLVCWIIADDSHDVLERERQTEEKYYQPMPETSERKRVRKLNSIDHSNWMSSVSDDKKLTHLSIPGTHESCALYGGPLAQCQEYSLYEQCVFGVRYFDIRCRHINNVFMIHHGVVYQHQTFGRNVRDVFIDFLEKHPSETIIMCVKEEHTAAENTRGFDETMKWYIDGFESYFYLAEGNPRLRDIRGKIVLIRRFSSFLKPLGNEIRFRNNDIFDSITSIHARVQDVYHVPSLFHRSTKWDQFNGILTESRNAGLKSNKLFLNFGSGSSAFCYPYSVSQYINPSAGKYLEENLEAHVGILLFDFIELYYEDLSGMVIKRNLKKN